MSLMTFFPEILGAVGGFFRRKHEIRIKKLDLKYNVLEARATAEINMQARRQEADINWELSSIQNSGWKDEYLTILTTVIVLASFVPYTQSHVQVGFQILTNDTPIWFQVMIAVVYSSAFGVRVFDGYKRLVAPRLSPSGA